MRPSLLDPNARAVEVGCTEDRLRVVLSDQREISAPIACFPRLATAAPEQLRRWRLIADGIGIHREEIDEDLSVRGRLTAK